MINFRKIDEDNFSIIIKMKNPDASKYVAENVYSLAQAWLYHENGDVFPFAIYNDNDPVGFMMLEEDTEENKLMLWRIMFPPENCRKGYGTAAVKLLIDLARASNKYEGLYLDCNEENTAAMGLYTKLGFAPTGDINHGDIEMKYIF